MIHGNGDDIAIRPASVRDAPAVSRLLRSLAHFIVDDPDAPEVAGFLAGFDPEAVAARIVDPRYDTWLAVSRDEAIEGMLAMRDHDHVYHLFVEESRHRRGIASALWAHVREQAAAARITVNSSPRAEPLYVRFGFVPTGIEQVAGGVRFRPMAWTREP